MTEPTTTAEQLVISAPLAAKLLNISVRSFWKMNYAGQVPRPVRLGNKSVRWRATELRAWIDAGCPARDQWEALQSVKC